MENTKVELYPKPYMYAVAAYVISLGVCYAVWPRNSLLMIVVAAVGIVVLDVVLVLLKNQMTASKFWFAVVMVNGPVVVGGLILGLIR